MTVLLASFAILFVGSIILGRMTIRTVELWMEI